MKVWRSLLAVLLLAFPALGQEENESTLQPQEAREAFDAGLQAAQAGDLEGALGHFQRSSELGPTWSQSRYYEGACLTGLNRHEQAALAFGRAVEVNDGYLMAWAARADSYFHLGRYEDSAFDYGRVIELNPTMWLAYAARAEASLALGDLDAAHDDLSEAIDLEPKAGKAYRIRSQVRLLQGKILESIADAEHSIEHEPDNVYAALWLAALQQDTAPLAKFEAAEGWPGLLVAYFQGQLEQDTLLVKANEAPDDATRQAHKAEAHCWIAVKADLSGQRAQALAHYQACVATQAYFLIEYRWSLRRAAQLQPQ